MIRPTATILCPAAIAIGLAFAVSYEVCPQKGKALFAVEEPQRAPAEQSVGTGALHEVRVYPATEGRFASPFLPEHPTRRAPGRGQVKPPPQKEAAAPRAKPPAPQEIRLVGIISSESGSRAILAAGTRQIMLAPGEEKEGVVLLSLTKNEATVSTAAGTKVLPLSGGLAN